MGRILDHNIREHETYCCLHNYEDTLFCLCVFIGFKPQNLKSIRFIACAYPSRLFFTVRCALASFCLLNMSLDPILNTLMKDPVILPTSGQIVDRAVIQRHLLSEATDPFSMTPLRTEMLESRTFDLFGSVACTSLGNYVRVCASSQLRTLQKVNRVCVKFAADVCARVATI